VGDGDRGTAAPVLAAAAACGASGAGAGASANKLPKTELTVDVIALA
jgi:hypothetical protein